MNQDTGSEWQKRILSGLKTEHLVWHIQVADKRWERREQRSSVWSVTGQETGLSAQGFREFSGLFCSLS